MSVRISSPDKVLFPNGVTKRELADHYSLVARFAIPHMRDRPLTLHSYPRGIEAEGIYIKQAPKHFPAWVKRVTVPKRGGTVDHAVANRADTLVYLAGQNVVTPHVWLSRADSIEKPDRLIFDFDPEHERFAEVRAAARALGDLMRDLGLAPHAMTSGSRGLHVTVPLRRTRTFAEVRAFADAVGDLMVEQDPTRLTRVWSKAERGDRIYVDTGRNAYAQHAVAPYAVRAKPDAPVATPLRWEELEDRRLRPNAWTVRTIGERLESEGGDPWAGIAKRARPLPSPPG
ncbi:MAG TPA: non-homologous end-joining DNA ligase [Thermoleophilaceae bacterium]